MAQNQPKLGGFDPFYGWYMQISGNFKTTKCPN